MDKEDCSCDYPHTPDECCDICLESCEEAREEAWSDTYGMSDFDE